MKTLTILLFAVSHILLLGVPLHDAYGQTVDATPPEITILGLNPVAVTVGELYVDAGARCTDNLDDDKPANATGNGTSIISTSAVGNYIINYDCTDAAGNPADRQTRYIVVATTTQVTIGALVPESGSLAFFGVHLTFAIENALDNFNTYLSAKNATWHLAIDIRDTASDTDTALRQAESLINDDIEFISGPARSSSVDAIKTYLGSNPSVDLSLVSYSSTAPALAVDDSVYRLVPSDDQHGPVIANLMDDAGKTVVIPVYVNDPFGRGLSNSTAETFTGLGHTSIYQEQTDHTAAYEPNSGMLSYKDCTDQNGNVAGKGNPTCDGQFPDIVSDLNDLVLQQIKANGADRIFVLYVGFDSPIFIAEAIKYPALRLVEWVGSDADVQKPELVENVAIANFLSDTNFRTCTFEFDSETARFVSLERDLSTGFPDETPLKYVYSGYDTVWAIGLAIEAAGGASYTYDAVDLAAAINNNDEGALGDVTLDEFGDLGAADFGVFGIEDDAWERIATYFADGRISVTYDDPTDIVNVGLLLSLDSVLFYDDDFAVTMALAGQDLNEDRILLHTIDTYDDDHYSSLKATIDDAIAGYVTNGNFSAINGAFNEDPYPFVVNHDGIVVAHGTSPNNVGKNADTLVTNPDISIVAAYDILASNNGISELWWQYEFTNAVTGSEGIKRSLLVYHAPSGYVIGAGYNPTLDARILLHTIDTSDGAYPALNAIYHDTYDDFYHPTLTDTINDAIAGYVTNGNFSAINGAFTADPYPFVGDNTGDVIAHGTIPSIIGRNADTLVDNPDRSSASAYDILASNNGISELWWQYEFENTATGIDGIKRTLLVYHEASGYLIGAGYNPPIGDAGHKPLLEEVITTAITTYDGNPAGDKFVGINGSFDPATDLFYTFVINAATFDIVAHAQYPDLVGDDSSYFGTPDRGYDAILSDLESGGTWVSYILEDPTTGLERTTRAWLVLHDGLIFASSYIIDERIKYFVGITTSQSATDAKPFFDSTDSILVSPSSYATSLAVMDNIYRLQPSLTHEKQVLTDLLSSDEKTSLVIVHFGDVWSKDYADSFRPGVPDANIHESTGGTDNAALVSALESSVSSISDAGTATKNIAVLFIGGSFQFIDLIGDIGSGSVLRDVEWYTPGGVVNDPILPSNSDASTFANTINFTSVIFGTESNTVSLELQDRLPSFDVHYHSYHNSAYDSVSLLGKLGTLFDSDFTSTQAHLDDTDNSYNGALGEYALDEVGDLHIPRDYHSFTATDRPDPFWKRTDKDIIDIGAIVESDRRAGDHRKYATFAAVSDFNGYLAENNKDWRLSINVEDSQSDADSALAAARSLYGDGISFISGPSISSGVAKIKQTLIGMESAVLSLVSCCSTAPSLAETDNIFRLAPADDKHGVIIANLMHEAGKKHLIPLHLDDPFGRGLVGTTSAKFASLGGQVDTGTKSYASCDDKSDVTCDGQFPDLVRRLAAAVEASTYENNEIVILYVGFELEHVVRESLNYPALRGVSWIGSDAQILSPVLVDDPEIKNFLADVNFMSCIFDADEESLRYVNLQADLESKFPGETPSVYAYSTYDAIWAIGLARDAAGLDASFEEVTASIPAAVQQNYGALGHVYLNEFGDLAEANYAVYAIKDSGWERVGTYFVGDRGFVETGAVAPTPVAPTPVAPKTPAQTISSGKGGSGNTLDPRVCGGVLCSDAHNQPSGKSSGTAVNLPSGAFDEPTCDPGTELVNGICQVTAEPTSDSESEPTPEPEPTCGAGTELVNGICQVIAEPTSDSESEPTCDAGTELVNGICQVTAEPTSDPESEPEPTCDAGTELVNGICQVTAEPEPEPESSWFSKLEEMLYSFFANLLSF